MPDLFTRRVTPAEVLAAYEATGLKPARTGEDWLSDDGDCGCGLAALYRAEVPEFANPILPGSIIAGRLGLSVPYVHGFTHGFDGVEPKPMTRGSRDPDFALGMEDGHAVAEAVFAHA